MAGVAFSQEELVGNDAATSMRDFTYYGEGPADSIYSNIQHKRQVSYVSYEAAETLPSIDIPSPPDRSLSSGPREQIACCHDSDYTKDTGASQFRSLIELKRFLLSAPLSFVDGDIIRQFRLPNEEQVSCVRWNQMYCITGTDIVRCLIHRFTMFGREVINRKKFEEGIFSDLRNLKINVDAILENPKSALLDFLYKKNCVRTKKKQKVFFWYSVHHEKLFIDALERELKKEAAVIAQKGIESDENCQTSGSTASTIAVREPALSFKFDSSLPLIDQLPSTIKSLPHELARIVEETTTASISAGSANSVSQRPLSAVPHNLEYTYRSPMTPTSNHLRVEESYPITPYDLGRTTLGSSSDSASSWDSLGVPHRSYSSPVPPLYYTRHSNAYPISKQPSRFQPLPRKRLDFERCQERASENKAQWQQNKLTELPEGLEEGSPNYHGPEDTDFPLDILIKEDLRGLKACNENHFETKYNVFAHDNRPAIAYANSEDQYLHSFVDFNQHSPSTGPLIVDNISDLSTIGAPNILDTLDKSWSSPWSSQYRAPTTESFPLEYAANNGTGGWQQLQMSKYDAMNRQKPYFRHKGGRVTKDG